MPKRLANIILKNLPYNNVLPRSECVYSSTDRPCRTSEQAARSRTPKLPASHNATTTEPDRHRTPSPSQAQQALAGHRMQRPKQPRYTPGPTSTQKSQRVYKQAQFHNRRRGEYHTAPKPIVTTDTNLGGVIS